MPKVFYSERPDETGYYPAPGGVTIRLRENIKQIDTDDDEQWVADEYQLTLATTLTKAQTRVARSRALFLAKAKELAKPDAALTVNDLADALMELGEMIAEQDDALVELAEMIGG